MSTRVSSIDVLKKALLISRALSTLILFESDKLEKGELLKEEINEDLVSDHLSFNDVSDLDLIIRTSGETRLSNFMLWESAYSEIYFTETLWPSFEEQEFTEIIQNYSKSERRFGSVTDQIDLKKA